MASVLLSENLFSSIAFPLHSLVADEAGSGHEAFRVADGRRSPYDYWEPTTANASHNLTLTCDRVRLCDMLALDRGHNLAAKQVKLECSDDNFTTTQTVFDIVLPSVTAVGSLDDAFGVRTEEGAWLKRFSPRVAKYWRLTIPALGSGLKQKIVGLHLGKSYSFDPFRPWSPDQDELIGEESMSDFGWSGSSAPAVRRQDTLTIQLSTDFDYELARYHFRHFGLRRPCWYVPDETQAQNALMIVRPFGASGFGREPQWFAERANIPYVEHEASNG